MVIKKEKERLKRKRDIFEKEIEAESREREDGENTRNKHGLSITPLGTVSQRDISSLPAVSPLNKPAFPSPAASPFLKFCNSLSPLTNNLISPITRFSANILPIRGRNLFEK